jgi:hypothetical protein
MSARSIYIGKEGSSDRLILFLDRRGLYLSWRPLRHRRVHVAIGPGYR